MWQLLLIPLSIILLVSALIHSVREAGNGKKPVRASKELKIKYPTAISPLSRR
jgi:hypothetical protein